MSDNQIICPHCGGKQHDPKFYNFDEWEQDEADINCHRCNKTFIASLEIKIIFKTKK